MTQKNKIWKIIIILIAISVVSYFTFNINIFKHRKEIHQERLEACQHKELNESCIFNIKNNSIKGTCQTTNNNQLTCQPQ